MLAMPPRKANVEMDPSLPKRQRGGRMETAPLDNPVVRRLFRVVSVLAEQPGISLDALIASVSEQEGVQISSATVRRDLSKLKEWGILHPHSHRKGYFIGTLGMTLREFRTSIWAIRAQAEDLKHPLALTAYRDLSNRLLAYDLAEYVGGYPTSSVLQRVGVKERGEEEEAMVEVLAEAMNIGRQVLVRRHRDPWGKGKRAKDITLFPLQFQFHDQAWYLLAEVSGEQVYRFQLLRLDRLHPAVTPVGTTPRGRKVQLVALGQAKEHQKRGWFPWVPPSGEGWERLPLSEVRVRLAPSAAPFFQEMPNRHPSQRLEPLSDGAMLLHLRLPSDDPTHFHFQRWLMGWGDQAELLAPADLREKCLKQLRATLALYEAQD